MRNKNEEIHLFILEEDRKEKRLRSFRERIHSGEVLSAAKQPFTLPNASFAPSEEEPCNTESRVHKNRRLTIGLRISAMAVACSLVSIIALWQLDAIVNQNLYSFGLQFSLEWAAPYWTAIRIAMAMSVMMLIAAVLFVAYELDHRTAEKETREQCETFVLADGSTVRVRGVIETLEQSDEYSIDKADYMQTDSRPYMQNGTRDLDVTERNERTL